MKEIKKMDFKQYIAQIPDFPVKGINFYDISPLLNTHLAWSKAIHIMAERIKIWNPDQLVGIESRGFLLAAPLSILTGTGFSMIRKPGKLPGRVIGLDYQLEYGTDRLEIQEEAIKPGSRVVILDDLIATGGTIATSEALISKCLGSVAGTACLIEIASLKGQEKCKGDFFSLISYET